jgi:hypothetical protein
MIVSLLSEGERTGRRAEMPGAAVRSFSIASLNKYWEPSGRFLPRAAVDF